MSHFLDRHPVPFGFPAVQELLDVLSRRYYNEKQIVDFLMTTNLSPGDVDLGGSARQIWRSVFTTARNRGEQWSVFEKAAADPGVGDRVQELIQEVPTVSAAVEPEQGAAGPAVEWSGPADVEGIERQLAASSTLLDVAFLERGLVAARSVARLTVRFPQGSFHGTAFRIGTDLLLTNHHVLFDWADGDAPAELVDVWFNYELDAAGQKKTVLECSALPQSVVGSKEHDWAAVRCDEIPDDVPLLSLTPKQPVAEEDRAYIIQHPSGGLKQIGLNRNLIVKVDVDVLQYLTDTQQGSSGAPVFNEDWDVVGLHHRWVELSEDRGGFEMTVYRNQGRRIERVVEGLLAAGLMVAS